MNYHEKTKKSKDALNHFLFFLKPCCKWEQVWGISFATEEEGVVKEDYRERLR